jgi:haloalkane dehalogenase
MKRLAVGRRQAILAMGAAGLMATASPTVADAARWGDRKKRVAIFSQRMAYYETGKGRPIVFLHGNPTSSYLWRNIIPHVRHLGRCIAPDLIGMGDSPKLPNPGPDVYTYTTHRKYVFELLRRLGVERDIIFVIHDWGSALGFDYASHNPGAVRGIAYSEAILREPNAPPQPPAARALFDKFQTSEGETLVLEQNFFVERLLIGGLK